MLRPAGFACPGCARALDLSGWPLLVVGRLGADGARDPGFQSHLHHGCPICMDGMASFPTSLRLFDRWRAQHCRKGILFVVALVFCSCFGFQRAQLGLTLLILSFFTFAFFQRAGQLGIVRANITQLIVIMDRICLSVIVIAAGCVLRLLLCLGLHQHVFELRLGVGLTVLRKTAAWAAAGVDP
eukprot:TRINITY_DN10520_c0_g1_i1.p3 TRINITY_DN10520_c0_g1~~TRINITY_DN10520_c0_g1_i1.p3  ORF type:complete len:184 (-),score=10.96 TRINITY_DN10520_c0_g1_i1:2425-2976(-)